MHWLDIAPAPRSLACVYCGERGAFPHRASYLHEGDTLSLFACTGCGSLIYDLSGIDAPIVSDTVVVTPAARLAARYTLEGGFSSHFVALCALACMPEQASPTHLFVDVGAGLGMSSLFARQVLGLDALSVEPSHVGGLARDLLGIEVHQAYFEDLPPPVLQRLKTRKCLLHLNSVVEHLVDPAAVIASMLSRADVDVAAMVVPDGEALDTTTPFTFELQRLAPRDHRHLPSSRGMVRLLERLGFPRQSVRKEGKLLIAVGSRVPAPLPSDREIRFAEMLFLEKMLRHPDATVAAAGAARLLPYAVLRRDDALYATLRPSFPQGTDVERLLQAIAARDWNAIPFHLGPSAYWLAARDNIDGRPLRALRFLTLCTAFADALADDHPNLALAALEFKWAALILRAEILAGQGRRSGARQALQQIIDASADPNHGPRRTYVDRAAERLTALAAGRGPVAAANA